MIETKPITDVHSLSSRFWAKVEKGAGCWNWTACTQRGYGVLGSFRAHRVSWVLHNGPIRSGGLVLHTCDNRSCVRPAHLYIGSAKENAQDRERRGRHNAARGESTWNSVLTEGDVREIRADYATGHTSCAGVGARYGVTDGAIHAVMTGRSWAHVGDTARGGVPSDSK